MQNDSKLFREPLSSCKHDAVTSTPVASADRAGTDDHDSNTTMHTNIHKTTGSQNRSREPTGEEV